MAKKTVKKTVAAKTVKKTSPDAPLAQVIRDAILGGLTNAEIREALKLPSEKAHYPAWYRSQLRRTWFASDATAV